MDTHCKHIYFSGPKGSRKKTNIFLVSEAVVAGPIKKNFFAASLGMFYALHRFLQSTCLIAFFNLSNKGMDGLYT